MSPWRRSGAWAAKDGGDAEVVDGMPSGGMGGAVRNPWLLLLTLTRPQTIRPTVLLLALDAKSKDLTKAFGTDDQTKICIEILEKGELQVSGKEREAQLSSQFRDIATIVMEKTIKPDTRRPYTITMIERLMHEIHFAVDHNLWALKVIKKLIEHFPIKRAPLRVRFTAPKANFAGLMEKVAEWNATVISKDESGTQPCIVCEIEPSILHSCEERLKDVQGRVEVLSVSAHAEGGPSVEQHDNTEAPQPAAAKESDAAARISDAMQKQSICAESQGKQQRRCKECDVLVEDKLYREHCKSGWHKHNYTRSKNGLPPLSQEECMVAPRRTLKTMISDV